MKRNGVTLMNKIKEISDNAARSICGVEDKIKQVKFLLDLQSFDAAHAAMHVSHLITMERAMAKTIQENFEPVINELLQALHDLKVAAHSVFDGHANPAKHKHGSTTGTLYDPIHKAMNVLVKYGKVE
jgi:hypothetical protein